MEIMIVLLLALAGALVPTFIYVRLLWWLDRYEKEPLRLLVMAFLWGAIPAAFISMILEVIFSIPTASGLAGSLTGELIEGSLLAPVIEEGVKGLALLALILWSYKEFDSPLDGIIYGGMIGFGFAMTEDFFYFLGAYDQSGLGGQLFNIFLRTVVFGLNHAFFTAITGAALGGARLSRSSLTRLTLPPIGWALAVFFHGLHNLGATLAESTECLSILVSLFADWGGVFVLLIVASVLLRQEKAWIATGLQEEVNDGLLAMGDPQLLANNRNRFVQRWSQLIQGGWSGFRRAGEIAQVATEIAYKKQQWHMLGDEGSGDESNRAEIHRLRARLAQLRGLKLCFQCGQAAPPAQHFCTRCGTRF